MDSVLDWNQYIDKAREVAAEGCVLLSNEQKVLPLLPGTCISLFGRMQNHYYKSGTGSGGMVNVSKVWNIPDGIRACEGLSLNEELFGIYEEWEQTHPVNEGEGWGSEPWCQEEMPLTEEQVTAAAGKSTVAVAIIARTAGEDKDASDTPGSYRLTEVELQMLRLVRKGFSKLVVILNVGNIIDMSFMDEIHPDAVLYGWQGGMVGGLAIADILSGAVNPSGHLTDTIAYHIEDYPSFDNFGDALRNFYQEDIYVGYRYFQTFAPKAVRYPFGYGLSYTDFSIHNTMSAPSEEEFFTSLEVKNIGACAGKAVVQIYVSAPQGNLGKPAVSLIEFAKTRLLEPNDKEVLELVIPMERLASFDDSGFSGHKNCWVLEQGEYTFYMGTDCAHLTPIGHMEIIDTRVIKRCEEALAPVEAFDRKRPVANEQGGYDIGYVEVPQATVDMDVRRSQCIPPEIPQTGDCGYKLSDVLQKKITMDRFIAQLSDEELSCIVRGEGMGSSLVTPGTASAFGGVSESLRAFGIPACCCDDGPSGMRLDCGTKAFSLPNGTAIACTYNPELIEELFELLGKEMAANHVDSLLGPGINIHRHPLNGRNFEYFSEDPYVTGRIACAQLAGLHSAGVTGTIKHFAGNNQEFARRESDSVISARALREIYLKAFEMAVCEGEADSIMTTYGSLNGLWTAGSYDLNTTILRDDWGYRGIVMTDWWASINERGGEANGTNFAAMVRAQNDLYMVCPDGAHNASGDNTLEALAAGTLTRAELQRSAKNICYFAMNSYAMKRLMKTVEPVQVLNRPKDEEEVDLSSVSFIRLTDTYEEDLSIKNCKKGTNYIIPLDVEHLGVYEVEITASSELSEIAQLPCTLFCTGIPVAVMTFTGSKGAPVTIKRTMPCMSRFALLRLNVGANGLQMLHFSVKYVRDFAPDDKFW